MVRIRDACKYNSIFTILFLSLISTTGVAEYVSQHILTVHKDGALGLYLMIRILIRTRSRWALEKAKENIDNHYMFVGTLENLEESLKILGLLLPKYFKNAHIYAKSEVRFCIC